MDEAWVWERFLDILRCGQVSIASPTGQLKDNALIVMPP